MIDTKLDKNAIREAFDNTETPALILHFILLALYGDELYGNEELDIEPMDPIEIWLRVKHDFGVDTSEEVENKVNALMLAVSTDAFFEDTTSFTAIVKGIVQGDIDDIITGSLDDLSVAEIAIAMFEVEKSRDSMAEFAPAVGELIDHDLAEEGMEGFAPVQNLLEQHIEEIQEWLKRLGVDADITKE